MLLARDLPNYFLHRDGKWPLQTQYEKIPWKSWPGHNRNITLSSQQRKVILKHLPFILHQLIHSKMPKAIIHSKSCTKWTLGRSDKPHGTEMKPCVYNYTPHFQVYGTQKAKVRSAFSNSRAKLQSSVFLQTGIYIMFCAYLNAFYTERYWLTGTIPVIHLWPSVKIGKKHCISWTWNHKII